MRSRALSWLVIAALALAVTGVIGYLRCAEQSGAVPADAAVTAARSRLEVLHALPRAAIAGTITAGGAAATGATACAMPTGDGWEKVDVQDAIRCVTAATGNYVLDDLEAGQYVVWGSAAARAGARRTVTLAPGARAQVDLELGEGVVALAGRVVDVRGHAIAGALIHARVTRDAPPVFTAKTTVTGTFVMFAPAGDVTLVGTAEGYVDAELSTEAPARDLELAMTPEATLGGIVVEAVTKRPIAGARVEVDGNAGRTDDTGRFRITKLAPGRYKATASAIGAYGEAAETVLLKLGESVTDVVIEVHPVAVVAGRILTEDGRGCPPDDGRVFLSRYGGSAFHRARTTGDGDVLLEGVVPGRYEVDVSCRDWIGALPYPDLVVGDSDVEATWSVTRGARVTGHVTAGGAAIAGATVNCVGGDGTRVASATTLADGSFVLEAVTPGKIEIHASAAKLIGSDRVHATASLASVANVELVLERGAALTGTVVDAAGTPMPGIMIRAHSDDAGSRDGWADAHGVFTIEGLEPGAYEVWATTRWGDSPSVRATVTRDATARVTVIAETPTGTITGTVVDARGAAVADAYVDVARDSGDPAYYRWTGKPVLAGLDGSFRITGLPAARFAVRAYRPGGEATVASNLGLGATVKLTLPPTATISGVVVDASGAVVEDVTIECDETLLDVHRRERLFHTRGRFVFRDLPAGSYTVEVGGDRRTRVELELGEAQHRDDLRLIVLQLYTLRGRLITPDKLPVAGYRVEVTGPPIVIRKKAGGVVSVYDTEVAITDAAGHFLVRGLKAGTAKIAAGDRVKTPDGDLPELASIELRGTAPEVDAGDVVVPAR
ncbi:MAG: carboxypeptidase-like regulatory domain-containing protein [Kofleriaceae bacterium]